MYKRQLSNLCNIITEIPNTKIKIIGHTDNIGAVSYTHLIEREIEILEYALRNEAAFVMYVGMTSGGVNSFLLTALLLSLIHI